jgi:type I restriction enzyme, S subunit
MELRSKYKQTEIGMLPEDWDVKPISESFEICNYLRYPISQLIRKKMAGEYPYYGPTKAQDYINEYRVEGEYALIGEDGDHFLKWQDSPMTLLVNGKFNVNNHAHLVKGTKNLTSWFYYYFQSKDLTLYLTRQGAGRYKLTKKTLMTIPCPIPCTCEQQAIATALSDIDALITSLDKLIVKKRDIKQATMQQLLTGKTRLPGFSGEWKVRKLGDVAEIKTGKKNNEEKFEDGAYPFFVRSQTIERIDTYSFDGEAILIPGEGRIGSIIHYINGKFDYHQRVYKISGFGSDICGKFVYFCMLQNFNNHAMRNSVKATVDSLRLPTFQEFEFLVSSFEEQQAITTVLSDMDAEIAALEQKREKTHMLKQGMMQELLTGKIRLV